MFQMPLQVAIYLSGNPKPVLHTVQIMEKSNTINLPLESAPEKIVLDPNMWLLMEATVAKN